jgi:hypothetical protein
VLEVAGMLAAGGVVLSLAGAEDSVPAAEGGAATVVVGVDAGDACTIVESARALSAGNSAVAVARAMVKVVAVSSRRGGVMTFSCQAGS